MEKVMVKLTINIFFESTDDENRFIVQDAEGEKLRRKLKPSELQVIKKS